MQPCRKDTEQRFEPGRTGGTDREALQGGQHPLSLYSSLLPSYGQPGGLH